MITSPIDDDLLTAFLDGETDEATSRRIAKALEDDPDLASRLERLQIPMAAMREAFDEVAASTPVAELSRVIDEHGSSAGDVGHDRAGRSWWMGLAAAAAIVLALGIGTLIGRSAFVPASDQDWHLAVAEYQALYTEDTLRFDQRTAAANRSDVERVNAAVGSDLSLESLQDLEGLSFKRAQILTWQGQALAQFAFLTVDGEPVAFCVTRTGSGDRPISTSQLKGLAVASWERGGKAFMVIGGDDPAFNQSIAQALSDKV